MSTRAFAAARCVTAVVLGLSAGCDRGVSTGPAPEAHDQDTKAGHMVNPAAGPNSPAAKATTPNTGPPAR